MRIPPVLLDGFVVALPTHRPPARPGEDGILFPSIARAQSPEAIRLDED